MFPRSPSRSRGVQIDSVNVSAIGGPLARKFIDGTSYTVIPGDHMKRLVTTNGSAVTITYPRDMFGGFMCECEQGGAGQVTHAAAAGATLNNALSHTKNYGQHAVTGVSCKTNDSVTSAVFTLYGTTAA